MFVATNRVMVDPKRADDVEAAFQRSIVFMDGVEGFVSLYVMRPSKADSPYVIMSFWETDKAYRAWIQSDSFRNSHAGMADLEGAFTAPPSLELHNVVIETKAA